MPPQVVRQQTAVPYNGVPPTTNFSLRNVFLPALISLFTNRNWRRGREGGLCMYSSTGTLTTQLVCQCWKSKENGRQEKKLFSERFSSVRVLHPTRRSGLMHYQVIVFGSMRLLSTFDCAQTRMDKNRLQHFRSISVALLRPPLVAPKRWVFMNVDLKLIRLQATLHEFLFRLQHRLW